MANGVRDIKTHIVLELGPVTIIMLAELLLVVLKAMGHVNVSWTLVLSPIILVIAGSTLILLFTLLKILKEYLF